MEKTKKWILYVLVAVLFVVLVWQLSHEQVTMFLSNCVSQTYRTLLGIDYSVLAVLLLLALGTIIYNFVDLRSRSERYLGRDIESRLLGNPASVSSLDQYLRQLKEFREKKKNKDILSKCLSEAAEECQSVGNFADYYNAAAYRIEKEMQEAPKISGLYNIANVAPIAGFLGTLIGMVEILRSKEFGDVEGMAAGLLVALITSILGLFISLGSGISAHLFGSKAERIRNDMFAVTRRISNAVKELPTAKTGQTKS